MTLRQNQYEQTANPEPRLDSTGVAASMDVDSASDAPQVPVDLYGPVHRGLRWAAADFMLRLGSAAIDDWSTRARVLDELDGVLYLFERHIVHEDRHLHPLIASIMPSAESDLAREHREHERNISELRALAREVDESGDAVSRRFEELYLRFASFVAHAIEHMGHEELVVAPVLAKAFSNEELQVVHARILADIVPDEMGAFMLAMLPAARPAAREAMLTGLRANAPAAWVDELVAKLP